MKGRKRTPTKLKILTGNPGKEKLTPDDLDPPVSVPKPPSGLLDKEAKKEWNRITKILERLEIVSELDRTALVTYCQNWSRWIRAEEKIREQGEVVTCPKTGRLIRNPWIITQNETLLHIRSFLAEFGMTPASRSRIHIENKKPKTVSTRKRA